MWTHDGTWFHLDTDQYSVHVLASPPEPFTLATDIEVHTSTTRWCATFLTPEQMREVLTSWAETGEWQPGTYLWVPDGVVVPEVTLDVIAAVVAGAVQTDGTLESPFTLLDDEDD